MEKINIDTMNQFKYISNLSSNESKTCFSYIIKSPNLEKNCYETSIYLHKDNKNICLIENKDYNFHCWLNEKTFLLSKSEKNKTIFYSLTLGEGEPKKFFSVDLEVNSIKKINDNTFILSSTIDLKKDDDFSIEINQIPFWNNGGSYSNYKRSHLFLYSLDGTLTDISQDKNFDVFDYDVNNNKVIFIGNVFNTKMDLYNKVYEYDIFTKNTTLLLDKDISFSKCVYSKNKIFLFGTDMKKLGINENEKVYSLDRKTLNFDVVIEEDIDLYNSTGSDARLGHNEEILVDFDNDSFYFTQTVENHTKLSKFENGTITTILEFMGSIDSYVFVNDTLYTISFVESNIAEIYKGINLEKISSFNDDIFKGKYLAKPEKIKFTSNGDEITGFVLLPENYSKDKTYPAILDIHGGPKTVYSTIYYHEMQVWANLGYIVMFTNPHGSSGRGNKFSDIRGKYGSIDYEDLMNFVDKVLENYSIDQKRIGVTGGSYGGFMTNWIITHTNRFACAATQRSISNWISMYGVSDIGYYFSDDQNNIKFNDNNFFEVLWDHSPLKYVKNCTTPTLIIHSDCDYRCPIDQGYQLLTSLLDKGVDCKMMVYKNENHELSRSGKPKARISRLKNITYWMNKYLMKGEEK